VTNSKYDICTLLKELPAVQMCAWSLTLF